MRPNLISPLVTLCFLVFSKSALSLTPTLCEKGKLEEIKYSSSYYEPSSIFKCDCQCSNEDNHFFIKHHTGYHKVSASRLLIDGVHKDMGGRICDTTQSVKGLEGKVFAVKTSAKDGGTCLDLFFAKIKTQYSEQPPSFFPIGETTSDQPHVSNISIEQFTAAQVTKRFSLTDKFKQRTMGFDRGSRGFWVAQRTNKDKQTEYLTNFRGTGDLWIKEKLMALEPPARIDLKNKTLILGNMQSYIPFINESLTQLQQNKVEISLSNLAPASAKNTPVDTLVLHKDRLRVKQYARISYVPEHDVHVGWIMHHPYTRLSRHEKSLSGLQIKDDAFGYHIEQDGGCKKIRYSIFKGEKYFRYCSKNKGIYLAQYKKSRYGKTEFDKMVHCDYSKLISEKGHWLGHCTDVKDRYLSRDPAMSISWDEPKPTPKPTLKAEDCNAPTPRQIAPCIHRTLAASPNTLRPLLANHQIRGWSYPVKNKTVQTNTCLSEKTIHHQLSATTKDKQYGMETLTLYATSNPTQKTPLYAFKLLDKCKTCDPITFADVDFDGKKEVLVHYGASGQRVTHYAVLNIDCDSVSPHPVVRRLVNYEVYNSHQQLVSREINKNGLETEAYCNSESGLYLCYHGTWVAGDVRVGKEYDTKGKVSYLGSIQNDQKVLFSIKDKATLYTSPNKATKQFLIHGDKVSILDQHRDTTGGHWFFVNYQRKSDKLDLKMWVQAKHIDTFDITALGK